MMTVMGKERWCLNRLLCVFFTTSTVHTYRGEGLSSFLLPAVDGFVGQQISLGAEYRHRQRKQRFLPRLQFVGKIRTKLKPRYGGSRIQVEIPASMSLETIADAVGQPSELPDSLDDAAEIAASCTIALANGIGGGSPVRCRIDFDTSAGDETFTLLKSSTEFMQKFATALCYGIVPGYVEWKQRKVTRATNARSELRALMEEKENEGEKGERRHAGGVEIADVQDSYSQKIETLDYDATDDRREARINELKEVIVAGGAEGPWTGDIVRIYFPDEGNAALAKRDWKLGDVATANPIVPACVQFASLGGVQMTDKSNDIVTIFFCPSAAEASYAEKLLYKMEDSDNKHKLAIFVNPNLVDMGVTGFGTAGRMLRERLIDGLVNAYYLRTLSWGALTRSWPRDFTLWQEDGEADGGYRMIKRMDRLPSNPEVEDIYDIENGLQNESKDGFGLLSALGDFVAGMTKL